MKSLFPRRTLLPLTLTLAVPALLPTWSAEAAVPPAEGPAGGFTVDAASREDVRNFYNAVYRASENVPAAWSGDLASCAPGGTDFLFRTAVLRRINFFRALAGVPADVALDESLNFKVQQAALMMAANGQINHSPPASWVCYGGGGAEAAGNANLSLGHYGPGAVDGQMRDDDGSDGRLTNAAVGHRRWLLYPYTRFMATGDVVNPKDSNQDANAIWVRDSANFKGARPATRTEFVAWPPVGAGGQGFVPRPLVFGRWSFSYPGADFSKAKVTMTKDGKAQGLTQETPVGDIADNTLAWVPKQAAATATALAKDAVYKVTIKGVFVGGKSRDFSYQITEFDPALPGTDTVYATPRGEPVIPAGQPAVYALNAVPRATGYQWRRANLRPALREGADRKAAGVAIDASPQYRPIDRKLKARGRAAFHLAHAEARPQTLTFRDDFRVGPNARLDFLDYLGLATSNQHAKVQVSLDDGASWLDVYDAKGKYDKPPTRPLQPRFERRTLDLAGLGLEGRVIRLRFSYEFTSGQYYPQTGRGYGWYIDEITPFGLERLVDSRIEDLPADTSNLTVQSGGGDEFMVQVRALAFGPFPLEWGPAARIVAVPSFGGEPRPFRFKTRRNVAPAAFAYSKPVRIGGLLAPALIRIAGGEYSLNGGGFTAAPSLVRKGDQVMVRVVSGSAPNATAEATVTIGGRSAIFRAVTGGDSGGPVSG
jgi:hypothetical protein